MGTWQFLWFLLLSKLLTQTDGFIPNQRRKWLSFTVSSRTHKDIIECAHRDAAVLLMNDYRTLYPDQAKAMSTKEFKKAVRTFRDGVAIPDLMKPLDSDPKFHFDDEKIALSNLNMIWYRIQVIRKISREDWTGARTLSGILLHTLQDFYSHSNWVEMQLATGVPGIHPGLADRAQRNNLGKLATPGDVTCLDCSNERIGTCRGNAAPANGAGIITTGYAQIWKWIFFGPANKKPAGKCSHGGVFDITGDHSATGGINKDANSDWLSPHHYNHPAAAALAKTATIEFFKGIRKSTNDNEYAKYLGLETGSSLCFVVDTTGSMSNEIAAVRATTVRITQDAAGSAQKPSDYVLSPFNDPAFGPLTKTKNSAVMIAALSALTASGGGDLPEMFFSGLNLALNNVRPGSTCFAFTDAPAKDGHLFPTSLALISSKDITVFIFLTGSFKRRRATRSIRKRSSLDQYRELALLSGGLVIDTTDTDIDEAVKVVDLGISTVQVNILQNDGVVLVPGTPQDQPIPVDETLTDLVISITTTGSLTSVVILDPSGVTVTPGAPGSGDDVIQVINVASVKLCTIASPAEGVWIVRITGSGTYNIRITAKSLVDFAYDFVEDSELGHGGFRVIDGKPLADEQATIVVQTFDNGPPVSGLAEVTDLVLVKQNGDELQRLDLFELIHLKEYEVNTTLPAGAFRVVLEGVDTNGNKIQRWDGSLRTTSSTSLSVVLDAVGTFWLLPGETIEITISVRNAGTSTGTYTLSVIDTEGYFVSITPTSLTLAGNTSDTAIATFTAPLSAVFGDFSIVSMTAKNLADENFVVFRLSIGSDTEDTTPPVCTITNADGDCSNTASGSSACEDETWSISFSAQDTGLGLHSVRPAEINPDANFTTDTFTEGSTDAVTGSYDSDCCVPRVEIVASDIMGNTGSCVVDYIPEGSDEAGECTVSDSGELSHLGTNSQLPGSAKSLVAQTTGPNTDPCKVKIQIRMDQEKVNFAGFNIAPWPGKPDKFRKNYVFDLWEMPGLSERGFQVSGIVTHTEAPDPWTDGVAGVTITQFTSTSWKLEATCNGVKFLTLLYGVPGSCFFDLTVTEPEKWTGLCYP